MGEFFTRFKAAAEALAARVHLVKSPGEGRDLITALIGGIRPAGTRVMSRMKNTTLRKLFVPVLVYVALQMVLRGMGVHLPWTK